MALREQSLGTSSDEFVLTSLLIGTIVESFLVKSLLHQRISWDKTCKGRGRSCTLLYLPLPGKKRDLGSLRITVRKQEQD